MPPRWSSSSVVTCWTAVLGRSCSGSLTSIRPAETVLPRFLHPRQNARGDGGFGGSQELPAAEERIGTTAHARSPRCGLGGRLRRPRAAECAPPRSSF